MWQYWILISVKKKPIHRFIKSTDLYQVDTLTLQAGQRLLRTTHSNHSLFAWTILRAAARASFLVYFLKFGFSTFLFYLNLRQRQDIQEIYLYHLEILLSFIFPSHRQTTNKKMSESLSVTRKVSFLISFGKVFNISTKIAIFAKLLVPTPCMGEVRELIFW